MSPLHREVRVPCEADQIALIKPLQAPQARENRDDLPPEYAISIPHVTVIHRSGLVVRNGKVGDLEPLVQAMLDEPEE